MRFLDFFRKKPAPPVYDEPVIVISPEPPVYDEPVIVISQDPPPDMPGTPGPGTKDLARAPRHVARFERAVAQCAKGDTRLAELRAWLEYWRAVTLLPPKPE